MFNFLKNIFGRYQNNSTSNSKPNQQIKQDQNNNQSSTLLQTVIKNYGYFAIFVLLLGFQLSEIPELYAKDYRRTKIDKSQLIKKKQEAQRKIAEARKEGEEADQRISKRKLEIQKVRDKWYRILKKKGYADPAITKFLDKKFPLE